HGTHPERGAAAFSLLSPLTEIHDNFWEDFGSAIQRTRAVLLTAGCPRCGTDNVAHLAERFAEAVGVRDGGERVDAGAGDGRVPIALAVARRQLGGIDAQFAHRLAIPAQPLEEGGQIAPRHAGGDKGAIFARDAPADEKMQQAPKVAASY